MLAFQLVQKKKVAFMAFLKQRKDMHIQATMFI